MSIREIPLERIQDLRRGDIIRHAGTGTSFVVDAVYGDTATAARTVQVVNPSEWIVVVPGGKS